MQYLHYDAWPCARCFTFIISFTFFMLDFIYFYYFYDKYFASYQFIAYQYQIHSSIPAL